MAMTAAFRNAMLDGVLRAATPLITYIGLIDTSEITGGSYARKAVTWVQASGGISRPSANLVFDIPAGATVKSWAGFSAETGGTNYGGAALTNEVFAGAGQYTLLAASTGILASDP